MGENSFYYLKWVICLNKRWAPENLLIPFFPLVWENKRRLTPSPCTGTHTHTHAHAASRPSGSKEKACWSELTIHNLGEDKLRLCSLCGEPADPNQWLSNERSEALKFKRTHFFLPSRLCEPFIKKKKKSKKIKATEKRRKCIYYTTEMLMDLSTVKQITRIIWISYVILRDVTSVSTDPECVILTLTSHSMDLCRCLSEHRDGCESSLHDNGPQ